MVGKSLNVSDPQFPNLYNRANLVPCHAKSLQSCPTPCSLWAIAHQSPLSMGFSRQEYWNGLPFPTPGHLPDPGVKPVSLTSPVLAGGSLTMAPGGKPHTYAEWALVKPYLVISPSSFSKPGSWSSEVFKAPKPHNWEVTVLVCGAREYTFKAQACGYHNHCALLP